MAWPEFKRVELWEVNHWHSQVGKIRFGKNWDKRSKARGFRGEESGGERLERWEVLWQNDAESRSASAARGHFPFPDVCMVLKYLRPDFLPS